MRLSISNIAWAAEEDGTIYAHMKQLGFTGLEIAPTRFFPEAPYNHEAQMAVKAAEIRQQWGFKLPSMQSLLFGKPELLLFEGGAAARAALMGYMKQAVNFAAAAGIRNLVFGNPKNRISTQPEADKTIALDFFSELAQYAQKHACVIGLEPNPAIYGGNYITHFSQALELCQQINKAGLRVNFDLGAMLANKEPLSTLRGNTQWLSHVHISEPMLAPINPDHGDWHRELHHILSDENYQGYVSIEMGRPAQAETPVQATCEAMSYIHTIFCS